MGVAEACDGAVGVEVTSDIVPASAPIVRAELHHTKGGGSSWVDVPHPVGTDEGIHTLSKWCARCGTALLALCWQRQCGKKAKAKP